jgi:hypothetical protein
VAAASRIRIPFRFSSGVNFSYFSTPRIFRLRTGRGKTRLRIPARQFPHPLISMVI